MPDHARDDDRSTQAVSDHWKYGLWAVLSGLAALVIVYVAALVRYSSPADVAPLLGPALATIGTLTAAYFGIQAGSAGKEQADAAKDAAHIEAMKFAAIADPDRAAQLLGLPAHPGGPDGPNGGGGHAAAAPETAASSDEVREWTLVEDDPTPTTAAHETSEIPQQSRGSAGEF